ncbi:MAG: RnfABCDGE type electron transport complex subunit G [Gammaproteobacteria bacterium]|nr:RnfABCDGE type electron transport complex subunit G [Gammaproteobacteria bacterium]MBU1415526.1 RnfABCDGE type electron transport complex subunit G [Gammaproteobacteria bacterium]
MAATYQATKPILAASAAAEKLKLINEVLPPASYDNDLLADAVELPPIVELGTTDTSKLYRARKNGQPVALVLEAVAPDGYAGRIALVLAVTADGQLTAVRVTGHMETPGLGDYVDPKKDKNKAHPWIAQFDGRSYELALAGRWKVKKDGGEFAYHTGATVSARAVTNASGKAVAWTAAHGEKLFALPIDAKWEQ